ncbi:MULTISPECIES: FMN-dependent NADH-azoreductase [Marisediminitalea]|jgi:FMN-dependent NADH-azoreductase|uniref:FMN-dependent NADH-azoreductase n=1 Tax=Marisediminitalea TaxID=2662254 RepID=UPI0020CEB35D|nr:NAD(P)H-dependent oxidoreductase [Marisediminitalea aggregata]MCP3862231.1 FMN-dependent NADH-azoreductase [Aestuariibacter sp.]MCP4235281.1 FMN-dependent NADH-azoreductase [Aestuariibacter sp.]MCP4526266.1 FMN-dependent NADH-azoreductase [Aestuariibacter sp.]MCP4948224.1 FMN-dependent NADH-azoreductase [Aestuariibacter sp.]MCP5009788.1 FMN-dependent NADH-azoreductase [Aestuariibacter sp.]
MKNILVVNSSLNSDAGNSSKLVANYLDKLAGKDVKFDLLDLNEAQLPHLTQQEMAAWMTAPEERTQAQAELAAISDALLSRLEEADEVVIGLPMYNLGVPSTFKAWIDRLARAGKSFKYTETGPVGLIADKPVTVLAARGGVYAGTDYDTQTPYIRHIFGLMGITSVNFVYAEGLNMGEDAAEKAFSAANEKIIELLSN